MWEAEEAGKGEERRRGVHALTYVLSIEMSLTVTVLCREEGGEGETPEGGALGGGGVSGGTGCKAGLNQSGGGAKSEAGRDERTNQ